jgi:RNA polymerase sigma factor (sigma-70 family)
MDSEEIIIRKAVQGNEQAFRLLVENYQSFVFKVCINVIKDNSHAENIAQETFLQVYRALPTYEFKGFKTWLGRIAMNKAIDYQRKMNTQKKREVALTEEFQSTLVSDDNYGLENLMKQEDRKKILGLCNTLPDIYKSIVNKYYIQQKCYSDIALEENISIKTVESRLYRAKKMLREKWEEEENI